MRTRSLSSSMAATASSLLKSIRASSPRLQLSLLRLTPRRLTLAFGATAATSTAALACCEAPLISATQQEDIAFSISESLSIGPLMILPQALKLAVISRVVAAVTDTVASSELDQDSRTEIQRAAESYSEGVSAQTVERVVAVVSKRVSIPIVDEAVEGEIIRQTVSLMLGDTSRSAWSKCPPWQCSSSPPVPPQSVPAGAKQLGTPRVRPSHWAPSHRLGAQASRRQSRRFHCL